MRINRREKVAPILATGAPAANLTARDQLERILMACLLWEKNFYTDGESVPSAIERLVPRISGIELLDILDMARNENLIRHAPLLVVREMARYPAFSPCMQRALEIVIQRPDEITEFLAIYWKEGKQPLGNQVKKGLGNAFKKFNEYQLAKWDRANPIRLRDVLFLCHPKPVNVQQENLWSKLANNQLEVPDTWEVALSGGEDKNTAWTRLITNRKLGSSAILQNLRNMTQANVQRDIIREAISQIKVDKVLPMRFIMAAKYVPDYEPELEAKLLECIETIPKLRGRTGIIIDASGSMSSPLSAKSDLRRIDAALILALLAREICTDPVVYITAGDDIRQIHATRKIVPLRRGFAFVTEIGKNFAYVGGGGVFLKQVCDFMNQEEPDLDRVIVITDEQDCDNNPQRSFKQAKSNATFRYLVNIASELYGIGSDHWERINGWSPHIFKYMSVLESTQMVDQLCL